MEILRSSFYSAARKVFINHFKSARFMSSFKETKINLDGYKINYLKTGVGEKNIFFLPGALGTIWSDFKPQIEGFDGSKFTIYAWDPPGYGKSRPPLKLFGKDFYHKDAQLAADLMKAVGAERYSVLGWSDGGITGLILAAQQQQHVDKLVVWGANAFLTQQDIEIYQGMRDVSSWSERMRRPLAEVYGGEAALQRLWGAWVDALTGMLADGGDLCRSHLSSVLCPTLVLHGDKDPVVPSLHPLYLSTHLPNAVSHHFKDGKHNLHLKFASEFNKLVQTFILSGVH